MSKLDFNVQRINKHLIRIWSRFPNHLNLTVETTTKIQKKYVDYANNNDIQRFIRNPEILNFGIIGSDIIDLVVLKEDMVKFNEYLEKEIELIERHR